MRKFLPALFLVAVAASSQADYPRPVDFMPLTSLPWKAPGATLETTLHAIFMEPNGDVRYPILAEYLRTMPVDQLGRAFDLCITLEDRQRPNELVYLFLRIWAQRDPQACWKRTQSLFHVVGLEDGMWDYAIWKSSDGAPPLDRAAIEASPFWIIPSALKSFPLGVDVSALPEKRSVALMQAFAEKWLATFKSWPGIEQKWEFGAGEEPFHYWSEAPKLMNVFALSPEQLKVNEVSNVVSFSNTPDDVAALEMAERRRLEADPTDAPEIIRIYQALGVQRLKSDPLIPKCILLLWSHLDQPGMLRWAESQPFKVDSTAFDARAILMASIPPTTRQRWLTGVKSFTPSRDLITEFITRWTQWDPDDGLQAAAKFEHVWHNTLVGDAGAQASYSPFENAPYNTVHRALEAIKAFDIRSVEDSERLSIQELWETDMEFWGEIDVGEDARFGVEFLDRMEYAHRDEMLRYFGGEDVDYMEGGFVLRTCCALRTWAIVRPKEMQAWIATLDDPKLKKVLTWMLNHPWGNR